MTDVRLLPYGPGAVLLEVHGAATVTALHRWLHLQELPALTALVPAARTVLVEGDASTITAVRRALLDFSTDVVGTASVLAEVVEIPVVYDGDDLGSVAASCGLSVEEVVRRHSAVIYTAAFCGFAPGFAYLVGGDPALQVPRRADPRTRVPAGSLAIAGEYTAVYPSMSPGGWHLLGRASVDVWSIDRRPPGLIEPGARVRFVP